MIRQQRMRARWYWVNMMNNNSYYANELSIDGQFLEHSEKGLERQIATWVGMHELLDEKGHALMISRSVLARMLKPGLSVQTALDSVDRGLASFLWNQINGWPYHEDIQTEFGARAFHEAADVTRSAPARAALRKYLDPKLGEYLLSCSSSPNFLADEIPFSIQDGERNTNVHVQNFHQRVKLQEQLGFTATAPRNWCEAIATLEENYPYVAFVESLKARLKILPWNANLYEQVDGKLARLNEIAGTVIRLNAARRGAEDSLANQLESNYHRLYQDMFAHEDSSFSDESVTNIRKYSDEMTFQCDGAGKRLCSFHTKFSYKAFRLHFMWPLLTADDRTYVVYLGRKITAE